MFYRSITAEIKQSYNASLVMCKSDLIRTQERLGLRYFLGSPEEQVWAIDAKSPLTLSLTLCLAEVKRVLGRDREGESTADIDGV